VAIVEIVELAPDEPVAELDVDPAPPAPRVIMYAVPDDNETDDVSNPPAPPPPP
jgi:hypothetical protein